MKESTKRLVTSAKVAIASAGLSGCVGCGADPPARPIDCSTVSEGTWLRADSTLYGDQLHVQFVNDYYSVGGMHDTAITDLVGASIINGSGSDFWLKVAPGVTSGSFRYSGTTYTYPECGFSRTFTFQITAVDGGSPQIQVSERAPLPLEVRDQARIVVLAVEGDEAVVEARTTYAGAWTPSWEVSSGEIVSVDGTRMRWRLPEGPGLHQVEVVLDYGTRGLSFDALSLERG